MLPAGGRLLQLLLDHDWLLWQPRIARGATPASSLLLRPAAVVPAACISSCFPSYLAAQNPMQGIKSRGAKSRSTKGQGPQDRGPSGKGARQVHQGPPGHVHQGERPVAA